MEFLWSERKRALNLKQHGLDFVDAAVVFSGTTFTDEDDRFVYNEQRFVTLGLLVGVPVSIVHTETPMKSASSPSEKRPAVKRTSSPPPSRTDWPRLKTKPGSAAADHPEADLRHVMRGVVRRGLKPQAPKAAISLRVERDVLEWFKAQGPGYQTRINAVLRAFRDASI